MLEAWSAHAHAVQSRSQTRPDPGTLGRPQTGGPTEMQQTGDKKRFCLQQHRSILEWRGGWNSCENAWERGEGSCRLRKEGETVNILRGSKSVLNLYFGVFNYEYNGGAMNLVD